MDPEHTRNGLTLVVPQDVSATVREALLRLCCMGRRNGKRSAHRRSHAPIVTR